MKTGIELITEERNRQIASEGFTKEGDLKHKNYELNKFAEYYLQVARHPFLDKKKDVGLHTAVDFTNLKRVFYPANFHPDFCKPANDRIRNLVKAGALIVAEIERLQCEEGQNYK